MIGRRVVSCGFAISGARHTDGSERLFGDSMAVLQHADDCMAFLELASGVRIHLDLGLPVS